ncbi:potassium voltage-gated channel [Strigomonas culicis]|nr:potassium voltage-gated channel [Strigomonas culicis]|eukprot:EPY28484.1 potassium voltage-gated channel [Strigomonas culicis]
MTLPTADASLRADVVASLDAWGLLPHIGPSADAAGPPADDEAAADRVALPDVCVVQLCDHVQHDQGVKRHAMTITYGADGFHLRELARGIRRDLNTQLSSTFWQCYQTGERAAFFATTKVANGAADILTTSILQQVVAHTERMGYHLASSYVTLSPDAVHTSVRMLIHNLIFRRAQLAMLEPGDLPMHGDDSAEGDEAYEETYTNFEPRHVGPQAAPDLTPTPDGSTRAPPIW